MFQIGFKGNPSNNMGKKVSCSAKNEQKMSCTFHIDNI